jgi:hypothetical protein
VQLQLNMKSSYSEDDLQVSITESKVVKEGYFGMNSYTLYRIETKVHSRSLLTSI